MKDIHLRVNLGMFTIAMMAWALMFGYQIVYPIDVLPDGLKSLFDTLTGVMLTIITAFQKEPTE